LYGSRRAPVTDPEASRRGVGGLPTIWAGWEGFIAFACPSSPNQMCPSCALQLTSQQRATRHKAKLANVEKALQLKAEQVMLVKIAACVASEGVRQ
jgi:hypothetical protein